MHTLTFTCPFTWNTGKAIGATPGEYKEFLYEPNVSLYGNGSLHFKKITKDAQGHFLCEAKNNIGAGVSKVIFLKVNGKLKFPNFISIFPVHLISNELYVCAMQFLDVVSFLSVPSSFCRLSNIIFFWF